LSEFTDYVEKQQQLRRPPQQHNADLSDIQNQKSTNASRNGRGTSTIGSGTTAATDDHAELDILDSLDLRESRPSVKLKGLFLEDTEATRSQLAVVIGDRLIEGNGEALFELGHEDDGKSMMFTKPEWETALDRLYSAAETLNADCHTLLTYNVGGKEEAENSSNPGRGAVGKIMIRRRPDTAQDVIETRIAVVGNGETRSVVTRHLKINFLLSGCWEKYYARRPSKRRPG
jgi:hypothetical protein